MSAQLGRVDPLPRDLAGRGSGPAHVGLDAGAGDATHQLGHLDHGMRPVSAGVERLARPAAVIQQLPDRQIRLDRVLDV